MTTSLGRQKLIMCNASSPRGQTISSLISSPSLSASLFTTSSGQSLVAAVAPLSSTALKISRECKLFEQHFPRIEQHDRMTLLSWFLEEEKLKIYENFKKEFYEEPDDYNYALSSLLGTFVWDVSNSNSMGTTFIAPNVTRRNQLFPWQAMLTEKWKVLQAPFSYSWQHVLGKTQRESLIMKSFIDTANLDDQMALSRRQAFDLRTSELSGRGFISFIQEHCLTTQSNGLQQGVPAVSLPQTENMSRVFKEWIESTNVMAVADEKEDHLFRRSCAFSLRDKCIYSRALFGTRLCLVVLDRWEQIIRTAEAKSQIKNIPQSDRLEYNTAEIPQPTAIPVVPKAKKKKKNKTAKKTKKSSSSAITDQPASKMSQEEQKLIVEDADFSEDEGTIASCTDSSGLSSPLGTSSEGINSISPTQNKPRRSESTSRSRETSIEPRHASQMSKATEIDGLNVYNDNAKEAEITKRFNERSDQMSDAESTLGETETESRGDLVDVQSKTSEGITPANKPPVGENTLVSVRNEAVDQLSQETDSEWLHVVGRRRRSVYHEASRKGVFMQQSGTRKQQSGYTENSSGRRGSYGGQNTQRWHRLNGSQTPSKNGVVLEQNKTRDQRHSQLSLAESSQSDRIVSGSATSSGEIPLLPPAPKNESALAGPTMPPIKPISTTYVDGEPTIDHNEQQNEARLSRKGSMAGSETTDLSSTSSLAQKKAKKRKEKALKKAAAESPPSEYEMNELPLDGVTIDKTSEEEPQKRPLALDTVTFSCAHCRRPRTYHSARQCALCGPNSTIRYCSPACQREDKDHWRLCGLSSFSIPIIIPEDSKGVEPLRPQTPWMSAALVRQGTLLMDNPSADYFLLNKETNTPLYKMAFADMQTSRKFVQLRQAVFHLQDQKAVTLMYKVIKSYVEKSGLRFRAEDVASQLFSEYGVHPGADKDSAIAPKEWIEAGVKIEG